MPRTRWLVIGLLVLVGAIGGALNAQGPFDSHSSMSYPQFLADVAAGRVSAYGQWRDRLEVTEAGALYAVTIPVGADFPADMQAASVPPGGVASSFGLPDAWVLFTTPFLPAVLGVAAALIWCTAVVRNRREAGPRTGAWPLPVG